VPLFRPFGIITIAWQWLLQAERAQEKDATARKKADRSFYAGKRHACDYLFKYELPKTVAPANTLKDRQRMILEITSEQF
jgi:butyryl-CoA dehydrogenase